MGRMAQFRLLLWKNYLLQRRKVLVTCLEIGIPTFFALILIFVRREVESFKVTRTTYWSEFTLDQPFRQFNRTMHAPWRLYFTPNSTDATLIMQSAVNKLNGLCDRWSGASCFSDVVGFSSESSMVQDFLQTQDADRYAMKVVHEMVYNVSSRTYWYPTVGKKVLALAGVVFNKLPPRWDGTPSSVEFKLRFPSTPRSARSKVFVRPFTDKSRWMTQYMFPVFQVVGPRGHLVTGGPPEYLEEGFLSLQLAIDSALIERMSATSVNISEETLPLQRFPYPPFVNDAFVLAIQQQFPFIVMLSFIFYATQIVRDLVYEKECRLKESMKLMGLSNWLHWLAWFIKYFIFVCISVAIETVFFVMSTGENGAVINYMSPTVLFVFLIAYALATIAFCFAASTFFSRANSAAAAGGVIYFFAYIPYSFLQPRYDRLTWPVKMVCCLVSNVAMSLGCQVIGMFEGTGEGVHWNNINRGVSVDDDFTLLHVILMLLLDSVIYALIAWYVEAVYPGEYGIPRPVYFPLLPSYWCGETRSKAECLHTSGMAGTCCICSETVPIAQQVQGYQSTSPGLQEFFESDPQGLVAGIRIRSLRKEFGSRVSKKVAVKDISLNMYRGQITALLGHNGAGKTTTMSILTGFFPPTSGTAIVNGFDIRRDIDSVRTSLGLCPQHNVLFSDLTVHEHLVFFTKLKGLPADEVDDEVNRMLSDVGLEDKRDARVSTLSGGMKRKLSVGIALVGGSKVVILDEPTSGMDPDARRQTWDLLQQHRVGRTIVLSTHFMDEADLLGDRIAIMASGVIRCCGTSLFLKNKYGVGYQLAIVKSSTCDTAGVTRLIESHVTGARLNSDVSAELSYVLPQESKAHFSRLLTVLDSQKEALGIVSYGVSVTTMDEVFIRVSEQAAEDTMLDGVESQTVDLTNETGASSSAAAAGDAGHVESYSSATNLRLDGLPSASQASSTEHLYEKNSGLSLFIQQFYGMLVKRVTNTVRRWLLTTSQLLVPVIFTIISVVVIRTLPGPEDSPPLRLDLSRLPNSVVAYSSGVNGTRLADAYASYVRDHFSSVRLAYVNNISGYESDPDVLRYLASEGKRSIGTYNNRYSIACAMFDDVDLTAVHNGTVDKARMFFNNQGYHASAISLNTFANALLRQELGLRGASLLTVNHPMPRSVKDTASDEMNYGFQGFAIAVDLQFGMSFLAASFVLFVIRERSSKSKHSQFVSGVGTATFWCATFVWDIINYLAPCFAVLIVFAAFDVEAFTGGGRFADIFLLMLLYGWGVLPLMYLLSFIFTVPSTGLVWLTVFNIFSGIGTLLTVAILSILQLDTQAMEWLFMTVFPNFCLGQGLSDFYSNFMYLNICTPYLPSCKFVCLLPQNFSCCKDCCGDQCFDFTENYFSYEQGGIGRHLTFLGAQGLFFFAVLLLVESQLLRRFLYHLRRRWSPQVVYIDADEVNFAPEDEDVQAERRRITETSLYSLLTSNSVVIDELTRIYSGGGKRGTITAVDSLSFGVGCGECFGLLGINGAGKTSTFQMLTGDIYPTSGDAYINSFSIMHDIKQVQSSLGYCPQFDALLDRMTGRETLYMFARLRGIPESYISPTVKRYIDELLLSAHADQLVASYSGGNKRKLSTAVALIGEAPVVFLDEPSTGLDPVARRHLWNALARVCASGRTLILTSHSMEECDALCTRIAIMVNGQLKCLGSPQHLKSKFGDGYSLIAKVASGESGDDVGVPPLCQRVERLFPGSTLKDVHHGLVQYHIPRSQTVSLAALFSTMEEIRAEFSVEDYSVSQTTLEQVFINFARSQQPPDDRERSGCCRGICCCLSNCRR